MSKNGIAWLPTKEARQIAKLDLAAEKRGEYYDRDLLPTKYDGNSIINNPNTGGLQPHRPWTDTPVITTQSWIFTSDDPQRVLGNDPGEWQYRDGSWITGSAFSGTAPAWNAYTYPDSSTGHTYDFTGSQWMVSPNITSPYGTPSGSISVQMWIYPTSNGVQILNETDAASPSLGYHYTMLSLFNDNNIVGRVWDATAGPPYAYQSSAGLITLNAWNHVYFSYNSTNNNVRVEVNGVSTGGYYSSSNGRYPPGAIDRFLIGGVDSSHMGATGAFTGKLGRIEIYDNVVTNNFNSQKTKYGL